MDDLYQRLDDARTRGGMAVRCPFCSGEAGFHSPFLYLTGTHADAAASDPGIVGVPYSGGFMAELFADVFLFSDAERADVRGRQDGGFGVLLCPSCGNRAKHRLAWPADAWFRVDVADQTVWAFTREHAEDTVVFMESLEGVPKILLPLLREEILLKVPSSMMDPAHRRTAIDGLRALL